MAFSYYPIVVLVLTALAASVACGGGGGGGTTGFTSVSVSSGTAAISEPGAVFMDSNNITYGAGFIQNGNIGFGTLSKSVVNQAIYVLKRAASGSYAYLLTFETVNAGEVIRATGITTDSTGKTTVVGHVYGSVRINASLVLVGSASYYSAIFIQISSAGVVVNAGVSTNTGGQVTVGTVVLEASDAVGIAGLGSGSVTLAGQTLTSLVSDTFYFRLSSAGVGIAKQKGNTEAAWASCYNPSNGVTYLTGSVGSNFYVAGLTSAAAWVGPYVSAFTGPATFLSDADGLAVVCLGSTIRMSGSVKTETGVTLSIAGVSIASGSQTNTFTASFDSATLAPLSANQGYSISESYGRDLVKTPTGAVWGLGDILGGLTLSGVALPNYSPNYSVYLSSIDSSSVYANATIADATKGQVLALGGMAMGVNSNKLVMFVKTLGTPKFGTLSAGAGNTLVEYTVA